MTAAVEHVIVFDERLEIDACKAAFFLKTPMSGFISKEHLLIVLNTNKIPFANIVSGRRQALWDRLGPAILKIQTTWNETPSDWVRKNLRLFLYIVLNFGAITEQWLRHSLGIQSRWWGWHWTLRPRNRFCTETDKKKEDKSHPSSQKTTRRRWGHETVIRARNSSVSHRSAADKSSQGEAGRQTRRLNSDTGLQGDECEVVWSTLSALVARIPRRYIGDSRQPCSQNPLLIW